jgi:cytochrome c oxidase assembly factor CtaG
MNLVVSHWPASLVVVAACIIVAAAHLLGVAGMATQARRRGEVVPGGLIREAVIFQAGLLTVLLAVVSPIGHWSQRLIWVRSVQDLLLANVAPALIVLGAPWLALRRVFGRQRGPGRGEEQAAAAAPDSDAWPMLPLLAIAGYSVAWCAWHLPALYDAVLGHPLVYTAEILTYLGLGVLFWLQLIGSRPHAPTITPLRRVMLLVGTMIISTVLAMVLVFGSGLLYPGYLGNGHHAFSVVADQQVGGAVLWVLMLPGYTIAAVALLIRWLNDEESQALATGLDRLLKPPKSAWSSRPGLR